MVEITVVNADITERPCDLLVLKHADGFHGVDGIVSAAIGFRGMLDSGEHAFVQGTNIKARKVLYLGVGPLEDFRYENIRLFASRALRIASQGAVRTSTLCSPVHGPGYGLDEGEALLSLVGGFFDAIESGTYPADLQKIEIVELNSAKSRRYADIIGKHIQTSVSIYATAREERRASNSATRIAHDELSSFGAGSEKKPKLFVAMPFADEYSDVWEIAIQESCTKAGIVCERIKEQKFVGSIMQQIKTRVDKSNGLVAVLDGSNPNVFLEIGYAWALGKPTILIAKDAKELPFDVRDQRCITYRNINELRKELTAELDSLRQQGALDG